MKAQNILKNLATLLVCITTAFFVSCEHIELPEATPVDGVSNLAYTLDGRNVTLTWTLPADTGIVAVRIYVNNENATDVVGTPTTYTFERAAMNKELAYTVKVVYSNDRVSEGQTVRLIIEGETGKIAYLIDCNSIAELTDDDEIAAANWFVANITKGEVLTSDQWSKLNADEYLTAWVHIDRKNMGAGVANLPSTYISETNAAILANFVKEGGNLLLTKHATQLITAIGRTTYAPGIYADGDGGTGTDIWTINAVIGSGQTPSYDHRSHKVFAGLSTSDQYTHETYPLIGPGEREDHNCMWDLNACGFDGTPNIVEDFQEATNSTVLATWGHVTDYCCAGIVDFAPTTEFKGRCLAIGFSAYEWTQNSGTNPYQSNIELLTSNSLKYLSE